MDLHSFVKQVGRPRAEKVAAAAGIRFPYLYQIAIGFRKPSARRAILIEEATGGKVTKEELLPEVFGPPKRRRA